MPPAHQSLGAHNISRSRRDDRLIAQFKFLAGEGRVKIELEILPLPRLAFERRIEKAQRVSA